MSSRDEAVLPGYDYGGAVLSYELEALNVAPLLPKIHPIENGKVETSDIIVKLKSEVDTSQTIVIPEELQVDPFPIPEDGIVSSSEDYDE